MVFKAVKQLFGKGENVSTNSSPSRLIMAKLVIERIIFNEEKHIITGIFKVDRDIVINKFVHVSTGKRIDRVVIKPNINARGRLYRKGSWYHLSMDLNAAGIKDQDYNMIFQDNNGTNYEIETDVDLAR